MLADLRSRIASFDLVHIHGLYRFHGIGAAAIARSRGVPYVIQAHGSLDPWHRNQKRLAKDLYHAVIEDQIIGQAAAMVCTSRHEQRSIRALDYAVPTEVIPVGIDAVALRKPGNSDILALKDIPADAQIVSYLGRISAKKGVPLLVDAFRRVAKPFPRAHLVIAGPDDEGIGQRLAPLIVEAELANRVSFLGVVDASEKATLLQRSEAFVLPSADESFGVAVAEAMAVGCPVVVTPGVAIQDVVTSAGAGVIVDRHPPGIADAIAEILGHPARGRAMGEAGRRLVDEHFSWSEVAARTEALYESVIGAKRIGVAPKTGPTTRINIRATAGDWGADVSCPQCGRIVRRERKRAAWPCQSCGWTGREADGIPILLARPELAEHDEIDHAHKAAQVAHFDRATQEQFETERPHGTPLLYRFLLAEKFRRAIRPIRPHLVRASVLIVCGGSGMDAEVFARLGAEVTTSDLSLGAARRAVARSARYGVPYGSVVADVERLPYPDHSVDVVAVHDGLHHLEDPFRGLSEMSRVARRWVVVTEPARASVTKLATRLGLAREMEDAGNRVARMDPAGVADFLQARGYAIVKAERYGMYYPHHPGAAFRVLSLPGIFPIVRISWRFTNAILGRIGNKMVVVAERDSSAASGATW
jgi:glycosyltransferase involved in cell wall biosynthesis/SAM-dependent methyltransferase/ribosomal protein L37AE/L43A